jgi:hypothetical protein
VGGIGRKHSRRIRRMISLYRDARNIRWHRDGCVLFHGTDKDGYYMAVVEDEYMDWPVYGQLNPCCID